jgi:Protein of unknown function (DUF2934)
MTDRDERIREIAYFLWLEHGSPDGDADRHWLAAETLVDTDPIGGDNIGGEAPGEPNPLPIAKTMTGTASNGVRSDLWGLGALSMRVCRFTRD